MVGIGIPLLSPGRPHPDITPLKESGNTGELIRLLGHRDPGTRWRAAEALGSMGSGAVGDLLSSLDHHDPGVRLGIVEALGAAGDPRAAGPLLGVLAGDRSAEVRWAAALALGNLGDAGAVPALTAALQDPDKYIRLGAALSLGKLGWEPAGGGERAALLIARQDWPSLPALGQEAAGPLLRAIRDPDPGIRARAVGVLGEIGGPGAAGACDPVLRDPDGAVRWTATLAFPKCGIPLMHLPMGLARRPRPGKSPAIAAFLNLFFLGLGYNYLDRWYGILLFQLNLTAIVLASLAFGPLVPYAISYGISTPFAVQAWYLARKMEEEAP